MKRKKKKMEKKKISKKIRKKVKLSSLFLLILSFSSATFAWYLYSTRVESGITAHVKAWNITFELGEEQIEEMLDFNIEELYPGMTSFVSDINVTNDGETYAKVTADIISINIMGDVYDTESSTVLTSATLKQSLQYDYPFLIQFGFDSNEIAPGGTGTFHLNVGWPYESSHGDEEDTYWGDRAYTFNKENPDEPSIALTIKITATQVNH